MSQINSLSKIFVIESLKDDEPHTGKELLKDTIERYNRFYDAGIDIHPIIEVSNKKEFLESLKTVYDVVGETDGIILHIEAHGSDDKKNLVLKNNDYVSWLELTEQLIPINKKLKNNLHLFNISCFGNYISQLIDLKKTSPFKSFIGSQDTIYPLEIINFYTALYDRILKSKDIYKAVNELAEIDESQKFFMKDLDIIITGITYQHLELFFKSGSHTTIKVFFDDYLNIKIDLTVMNNYPDPKLYILELFRKRFFYN